MPDSHASAPLISDSTRHRLCAVLGPTNTGKTHYALERMCGYATGMIGLPLRLLAREIYERLVALKGAGAVALITGEEKIIPRLPAYFVCTVEAMPLERKVDFLAVDEIQLCADAERGHVFTDRLLNARGRFETLFLGAQTFAPLFRQLFPDAEVMLRERLSRLSYNGSRKLTRLPPRSAIVAFSTEKVYAIAELIRRQRGGAAVVMGSLSPRTRNAQVDLFQRGEVDFLVATDAIGMGLNLEVDHVAFSGLYKFDGRHVRHLTAQEIAQVAGRAGRFTREGTFGVTGECDGIDDDLVHAVEEHRFLALDAAQWRNSRLEFSSFESLLRSLTEPSGNPALRLAHEAVDEKTLRHLAEDEEIAQKIKNPVSLKSLWDVCQLPDFRKIGFDEHARMVGFLFKARLGPDGVVPEEWFASEVASHDRCEGDIDTLSSRLAGMRTLTYIANRSGWLKHAEKWREIAREVEERLSDALHAGLMQRFVDQKTGTLLRALNADVAPTPEVSADGEVILEGHVVGDLKGLTFRPSSGETVVADKALRRAAHRAVRPLVLDRLREMAMSPAKAFRIKGDRIDWKGHEVARIEPMTVDSGDWFTPRIRLTEDIDHPALSERAIKRLTDHVLGQSKYHLKTLWALKQASEAETSNPAVRAIAFRLYEDGGITRRTDEKLSVEDRAALKALGVGGNRFAWFIPEITNPRVRQVMAAFGPGAGQRAQSQHGLLGLDRHAPVGLKTLNLLDRILAGGVWKKETAAVYIAEADFAKLDLTSEARDRLMLALGYVKVPPVAIAEGDERPGWRLKGTSPRKARPQRSNRSEAPTDPNVNTDKPHRPKRHKSKAEAKAVQKPNESKPYINPYSPFAVLRDLK